MNETEKQGMSKLRRKKGAAEAQDATTTRHRLTRTAQINKSGLCIIFFLSPSRAFCKATWITQQQQIYKRNYVLKVLL